MNLGEGIQEAQSIAGENVVLAHLMKAGLIPKEEPTWEQSAMQQVQKEIKDDPIGNYMRRLKTEQDEKVKDQKRTDDARERVKQGIDAKKEEKALRYNEGKLPWHLVDFRALEPMVRVLAYGAKKYSADNWKKGLSLTEIRDSFIRHMKEWNSGQEIDPESGESHIGHMMCNLLFYAYFTEVDSSKARD